MIKADAMKKFLVLILKIVVFMILVGVFLAAMLMPLQLLGLESLGISENISPLVSSTIQEVAQLLASALAAFIILHFWEKLPFSDLGFAFWGRGKDLLWGMLTAVVIYALGFGLSLLCGWVKVVEVGFYATDFFLALLLMVFVAMAEELMCRGFVLGRMLHMHMHPLLALLLSSLLFGALHLANPGFTLLSFVNITLAGMLLGTTYLYTRNLAFPIALHCFWNWIQGSVLGYSVSGQGMGKSVLNIALDEHTLLNGGDFGFEGSLVCTVLMVVFIIILMRYVGPRLKVSKSTKRKY